MIRTVVKYWELRQVEIAAELKAFLLEELRKSEARIRADLLELRLKLEPARARHSLQKQRQM